MTLSWWRLELPCPPELEDSLLWKLDALGVQRVALRHRPQAPEQRRLQAWLPKADWPESELPRLEAALVPLAEPFALELSGFEWHSQDDEDWSHSWKQHWQADPVGRGLLVLPAWLSCPPEHAHRLVIRIDPGSAFGTGSHPTTRLCLEALEALADAGELQGLRVADLGCGSGLLALAALRLGAAEAAAADIDSLAVRATTDNAGLNALSLPVTLGSVEALEALQGRPADLLVCNILAPVIEALAPAFDRILSPSGQGLLSGLLVDQVPSLTRALEGCGWQAELIGDQEPWGLMRIRRVGMVA